MPLRVHNMPRGHCLTSRLTDGCLFCFCGQRYCAVYWGVRCCVTEAERAQCLTHHLRAIVHDDCTDGVQMVEQSIMASGVLLLTGMSVLLIVRDLSHLSG